MNSESVQNRIARTPHICLVCFRSLSDDAGNCSRCRAPRLSLADPAVQDEVRNECEQRLVRRKWREDLTITGLAIFHTALIIVPLCLRATVTGRSMPRALAVILFIGIYMFLGRLHARYFPASARGVFAARRRRLSGELQARTKLVRELDAGDDMYDGAGLDPQIAPMPKLLTSLGARYETAN